MNYSFPIESPSSAESLVGKIHYPGVHARGPTSPSLRGPDARLVLPLNRKEVLPHRHSVVIVETPPPPARSPDDVGDRETEGCLPRY